MKPLWIAALVVTFAAACTTSGDLGDGLAVAMPVLEMGDSVTLSSEQGAEVKVTLEAIVDPVQPVGFLFEPPKGHHLVALMVSYELLKGDEYVSWRTGTVKVITDDGEERFPFSGAAEGVGPPLGLQVRLASGAARLSGSIAVAVPNGAEVDQVQLSLDSGSGEIGVWLVP